METNARKPDRNAIRELAEKHSAELNDIALADGNIYQVSLDQQDTVNEFVESLSEDEAVSFLSMYAEEVEACTNKTIDETNEILVKNEAANNTAETVGGIIGAIILFFVVMAFLD